MSSKVQISRARWCVEAVIPNLQKDRWYVVAAKVAAMVVTCTFLIFLPLWAYYARSDKKRVNNVQHQIQEFQNEIREIVIQLQGHETDAITSLGEYQYKLEELQTFLKSWVTQLKVTTIHTVQEVLCVQVPQWQQHWYCSMAEVTLYCAGLELSSAEENHDFSKVKESFKQAASYMAYVSNEYSGYQDLRQIQCEIASKLVDNELKLSESVLKEATPNWAQAKEHFKQAAFYMAYVSNMAHLWGQDEKDDNLQLRPRCSIIATSLRDHELALAASKFSGTNPDMEAVKDHLIQAESYHISWGIIESEQYKESYKKYREKYWRLVQSIVDRGADRTVFGFGISDIRTGIALITVPAVNIQEEQESWKDQLALNQAVRKDLQRQPLGGMQVTTSNGVALVREVESLRNIIKEHYWKAPEGEDEVVSLCNQGIMALPLEQVRTPLEERRGNDKVWVYNKEFKMELILTGEQQRFEATASLNLCVLVDAGEGQIQLPFALLQVCVMVDLLNPGENKTTVLTSLAPPESPLPRLSVVSSDANS